MVNEVLHGVAQKAMEDRALEDLLLDEPQLMGVESIELDTVNLRMVARTLPGKQFEVGRRLRMLVVRALRRAGIVTPTEVTPRWSRPSCIRPRRRRREETQGPPEQNEVTSWFVRPGSADTAGSHRRSC